MNTILSIIKDSFAWSFFPLANFKNVYDMIPNIIPSATLYDKGIITNVINAGIASVKSLKLILNIELAIKNPTSISIGAVAWGGIETNNGAKNNEIKNKIPVITAVNPVLPPTAIPDPLSTVVASVDVPNTEDIVVETDSANNAFFTFGIFPFSSNKLALSAIPNKNPIESNILTNNNVSTITNISKLNIW